MKFLDRRDEMRRLDSALRQPGSFAVIWGRRRVGKSRLLIEWSRRHGGLYTVADQSAPRPNIGALSGIADAGVVQTLFVPDAAVAPAGAEAFNVIDAKTVMNVLR